MNPARLLALLVLLPLLLGGCAGNKLGVNEYGVSVQDYVQIYSVNEGELLADGNILSITSTGIRLIWTVGPHKGKEVVIPHSMIGPVLDAECDS